jgi:hypothetical protein
MTTESEITILGGGPAGLAIGYYAQKAGLEFRIYEAQNHVGGNCVTLQQGGFKFDSGAHRFHDKDPQATAEIKRLHDRDKSAWWMVPFFALPNLYNHFSDRLPDSYFMLIPSLIMFVLMMWGFVELYFLRGSRKTNRFGPNPLLPVTTGGRWDQNSEIEMVPHKAGPPPMWRVKPGA